MLLQKKTRPQRHHYVLTCAQKDRQTASIRLLPHFIVLVTFSPQPLSEHLVEVEDLVVEDTKKKHSVLGFHTSEPRDHLLFVFLVHRVFRKIVA